MSHDLSLAQAYALDLARTLMVPVMLFQANGDYGVLPSADIDDDDDLTPLYIYDPFNGPAR